MANNLSTAVQVTNNYVDTAISRWDIAAKVSELVEYFQRLAI